MNVDPSLKGDWFVAGRTKDVPAGKIFPTRVLDNDLILWRSDEGLRCWLDLCIHRGAKLSIGSVCHNQLKCAYHGWSYDQGGRCVLIPAHPNLAPPSKARTTSFPVFERHGLIWMSYEPAMPEPPLMTDLGSPDFRSRTAGPYTVAACAPRMIENFLDVAHLPIVHHGSLGTRDMPEIGDYEVEEGPGGPRALGIRVFQPNPDGTGVASEVTYDYGVLRPLTVYLVKRFEEKISDTMFFVTPESRNHSKAYFLSCSNYDTGTEEQSQAFTDLIIGQDIPVVESQRPELLPLDLQAELHLRSDRMAIAYRQWLQRQNFAFGTS